ncbi:MAG: hypothetical protein HOV80_30595 [Polyangiaceae bacterium]|nr:hypothetical protein [Polyangiaceae bacterium]
MTILSLRCTAAVSPLLFVVVGLACSSSTEPSSREETSPSGASPSGGSGDLALARVRTTFGSALRDAALPALRERVTGRGEEIVVGSPSAKTGEIVLPRLASGMTELSHPSSGVGVEISLSGATDVAAEVIDGFLVHPSAGPMGSDVVVRPTSTGIEDYAVFWTRPEKAELRYALRTHGAYALRLHAGRLEVLDAAGAPRLRVEPPYVIDAHQKRHPARLEVEGCTVDRDGRVPWRREVAALSSDPALCEIVVSWSDALEAPLLVDPEWRFAANMSVERTHHTATLLGSGDVFVAGGFDASELAVGQTEIFCPDDVCAPTGAFTAGPSLLTARGSHTATRMPSSDKVLITGGGAAYSLTAGMSSAEVYDPAAAPPNDVVALPAMSAARIGHTATLLPSGTDVLIAGGDGASPSTAEVFVGASQTFGPAIQMSSSRRFHVAEVAGNDRVLVAGGSNGGPVASNTAELFDPMAGTFTPLASAMTANRAFATATRVEANGTVLIAGGTNLQGFYSASADLFVPNGASGTFQTQALVMQVGRATHAATALLGENKILISGGYNATGVLSNTEVFVLGAAQSDLASTMSEPHNFHAAVRQDSGRPVVFGGGKDGTANTPGSGSVLVASAISVEILFRSNGEACDFDEECSSKHCYDLDGGPGICCDETCSDPCRSCRANATADPLDADGFCSVVSDGHPVSQQCVNEVEFALVCAAGVISVDGGQVTPCNGYVCDAAATSCLVECADDGDCDEDHFCAGDVCAEKKILADSCAQGNECQSDNCIDGVCCNSLCDGQCEACDVEGSEGACVQVPSGPPHGDRMACGGTGSECEGSCGTNPTKCDYPQFACGDSSCDAGVESSGRCDGAGTCAPETVPCGAYACDEGGVSCNEACTDTNQCADGAICRADQTCATVTAVECDDHIVVDPSGTSVDCAPYRCDEGGCLERCVSVDDCIAGMVCDEGGACIDPPPDPPAPEDCGYRPLRSASNGTSTLLLMSALGLLVSRRKSRRAEARR